MASKKYVLILGLFSLFCSAAMAQSDAMSSAMDSSKIPTKRLPQQSEFMNNQYPYPAKPRSMWELGFGVGNMMIIGDVANNKLALGGTVSLRKAISHTFSLRAGYYGGYKVHAEPNSFSLTPAGGSQQAYKTYIHQGGFDLIASLTPNSPYRGNPKVNIYALIGGDLIFTKVFYKHTTPIPGISNTAGQFNNEYSVFYGYTAAAPSGGYPETRNGTIAQFGTAPYPNGRKAWSLLGGGSVGGGIAFKLSKRANIGVEQRFTFTRWDYLDAYSDGSGDDIIGFTSARLNLNIGSSAKKVEPLWWLNANNFVYNELNRPQHMKIPPPVLPDADGDGVTDQFDMEPNTPAGAPVDVKGVTKDTDNDGVPDYKDKELLTSQKCFPVDADGVGTCPEPQCCKELRDLINSNPGPGPGPGPGSCGLGNLPSIQFKSNSAALSKEARTLLASAAAQIKGAPNCRVKVIGNTGGGEPSKTKQQLSWDRVNTVIRYMVEKQGISQDRFIFSYEGGGDANTVDLMATTENGPNTVPAPHPNLKSKSK